VRARLGYASFLAARPEARNTDLYAVTIALLADVGKVREAKQLLDEWRTRLTSADPSFRSDSAYAVGSIAAAEGQWDKAATSFLVWHASPMPSSFHWFNRGLAEAATALARLGNSDSLRVLLERALDSPSLALGWIYETTWYPQVLQQLGDSYDARGDRVKAASYYQMYVELLKDADPPVAAQAKAVREKLAHVTGELSPAAVKVGRP